MTCVFADAQRSTTTCAQSMVVVEKLNIIAFLRERSRYAKKLVGLLPLQMPIGGCTQHSSWSAPTSITHQRQTNSMTMWIQKTWSKVSEETLVKAALAEVHSRSFVRDENILSST